MDGEPPPDGVRGGPSAMDNEAAPGALDEAAPGALVAVARGGLDVAPGCHPAALGGLAAAPGGHLAALGELAAAPEGHPVEVGAGGLAAADGGLATATGALAAQAGAADGLPQLDMENTNNAVALARALLPAAPLPAIEYNLPVLQVER